MIIPRFTVYVGHPFTIALQHIQAENRLAAIASVCHNDYGPSPKGVGFIRAKQLLWETENGETRADRLLDNVRIDMVYV